MGKPFPEKTMTGSEHLLSDEIQNTDNRVRFMIDPQIDAR
jgi:hypothetical protein